MIGSKPRAAFWALFVTVPFSYSGCATTGQNFYTIQCANDSFVVLPLKRGGATVERNGEEFFATTSPKLVTNFIDVEASFIFDDGDGSWLIRSSSLEVIVPDREIELIDLDDPSVKGSCTLSAGTSW